VETEQSYPVRPFCFVLRKDGRLTSCLDVLYFSVLYRGFPTTRYVTIL